MRTFCGRALAAGFALGVAMSVSGARSAALAGRQWGEERGFDPLTSVKALPSGKSTRVLPRKEGGGFFPESPDWKTVNEGSRLAYAWHQAAQGGGNHQNAAVRYVAEQINSAYREGKEAVKALNDPLTRYHAQEKIKGLSQQLLTMAGQGGDLGKAVAETLWGYFIKGARTASAAQGKNTADQIEKIAFGDGGGTAGQSRGFLETGRNFDPRKQLGAVLKAFGGSSHGNFTADQAGFFHDMRVF